MYCLGGVALCSASFFIPSFFYCFIVLTDANFSPLERGQGVCHFTNECLILTFRNLIINILNLVSLSYMLYNTN